MAELKLHLKWYSDMVQISVQAVTPKPHTENFFKLDLECEKRISNKKSGELIKQHNSNYLHVFNLFITSSIHPCQKRALISLKIEVVFNYDTFSRWHKVTRMAQS